MKHLLMFFLIFIVTSLLGHTIAFAAGQLSGSLLHTFHVSKTLPPKILEAIALVESGKKSGKSITPWPWVINVCGKGYTYSSKAEAIQAVRTFQARGFDSIDVGVMQVNLKHHPTAFPSLEDAFDPKKNIAYAAKFLARLYMKYASWESAIKHYHSSNPALGTAYLGRVMAAWAKVKGEDFSFGPIPLLHTKSVEISGGMGRMMAGDVGGVMPLLPSPAQFQSKVSTGQNKAIPISVNFFPIQLVGDRNAKAVKDSQGKLPEKKEEKKNFPSPSSSSSPKTSSTYQSSQLKLIRDERAQTSSNKIQRLPGAIRPI